MAESSEEAEDAAISDLVDCFGTPPTRSHGLACKQLHSLEQPAPATHQTVDRAGGFHASHGRGVTEKACTAHMQSCLQNGQQPLQGPAKPYLGRANDVNISFSQHLKQPSFHVHSASHSEHLFRATYVALTLHIDASA